MGEVTSMVERVAIAIEEANLKASGDEDYTPLARAAIEAMREPTDAMEDAALGATGIYEDGSNDYLVHYQAMIDAALNEQVSG